MKLAEHFRALAANNLWANDRIFRAVLSLEPGEFEAQRTSFFPSIAETLNHLLSVDIYYLDMLEEGGVGLAVFDRFVPATDATELAARQSAVDRQLLGFCENLSDEDCDRRVLSDRGETGMVPERIGDLLAHLFLHDVHHRGQLHAMLSGTSVKPPQLDEFFLDFDIPLRKDEVERLGLAAKSVSS